MRSRTWGDAISATLLTGIALLLCSPGPVARAEGATAPADPPVRVVRVGDRVPDFLLPRIQGEPLRLSNLKGRPVVLGFWAFWCTTWKEVHRGYALLARERPGLDFALVTVSIDCQWKEQLAPLLARGETPYDALMDPHSSQSRTWGVKVVPTICIIDGAGVLRHRFEGYPGNARILSALRPLAPGPRHEREGDTRR